MPRRCREMGLTGMRERVTALGGRLPRRPTARGRFTVRAELPLKDGRRVPHAPASGANRAAAAPVG